MPHLNRIRVGFIGAGGICRTRHLPNLRTISDVEVVCVANRSRASSQAVASEFGIPDIEDDWRRVIDRNDLDAVFIGTWPSMHREISIAALQAGKHVFCQARMAMDLAEGRDMLEAAQARLDLVNMVCPPPHRMPFEPFIRHTLATDRLGPLTLIELVSRSAANLNPHAVTWRERVEDSGKQVLAMGIYAETLNAWLGPYQSLSATTSTPLAVKHDAQGRAVPIGVPQVVTITGRLANGTTILEHHSGLVADRTSACEQITIFGLRGTLRHRFLSDRIELAEAGGELQPANVPAELKRPWRVELDFIEAVRAARRGEPPERRRVSPDFEEALGYMRKVEAVHRSAAEHRVVDLDELA